MTQNGASQTVDSMREENGGEFLKFQAVGVPSPKINPEGCPVLVGLKR